MQELGLDQVIVTQHAHVQWLIGPHFRPTFEPAASLWIDGRTLLVAPNKPPEQAAADDVVTYEAQWHSTLRNDQRQASSAALADALSSRPKPKRLGVEFSSFDRHQAVAEGVELVDIEPALYRLRRRKSRDELARIGRAIAATEKMYAKAQAIIEPGINELDVFNELQAEAVKELGEMLTGTGNDYASGARGGPPRDRQANAGELYILDLGPAYRGYFADNCRTFVVDGSPTDVQMAAWEKLVGVFDIVTEMARPGASCRALFERVQEYLDEFSGAVFNHHLGHGIGLFPHEAPHLNPRWDDKFEVGDVFTAEPGLYSAELNAGIRLENDYLVTESGVELLLDYPLQLERQ